MKNDKSHISYSLPPEIIKWVKDYAKKMQMRNSEIVDLAIKRYKNKIELEQDIIG